MEVKVGLIGFGIIGSGVAKLIESHSDIMKNRSGVQTVLTRIVDLDIETDRGVSTEGIKLSKDYHDIVNDPEIDIVIELVGGTTIAFDIVSSALKAKKHVVTANKALLYERGEELFQIASECERELRFEASVAGGIPIIKVISESLLGDKINAIYGIVNGTTNYILTKMIDEEWTFEEALKKAQELGFAEADPTLDINGSDAAHKVAILACVAFNSHVDKRNVYREGIEDITLQDVLYAKELGYVIKLLAIAKNEEGGMSLRVHPTLIPAKCHLANILNEFNAVMLESDFLGYSHYVGKGAGSNPTACAVVGDVNDLARRVSYKNDFNPSPYKPFNTYKTLRYTEIESRFYLRITTIEKAGILSVITKILGEHEISISAIIQKEVSVSKPIPIVILTHMSRESNLREAVSEIDALDITKEKTQIMHIEDMEM